MKADNKLEHLLWPAARVGESLGWVAESLVGGSQQVDPLPAPSVASWEHESLDAWLASTAMRLDLEAVAVQSTYGGLRAIVESCAPAILRMPALDQRQVEPLFFVIVAGGSKRVRLLGADGGQHWVSRVSLIQQFRDVVENDATVTGPIEDILNQIGSRGKHR